MSCCVGFAQSMARIEAVLQQYHPKDFKIFVADRIATGGIGYRVKIGVVVPPDTEKNTALFEALLRLQAESDTCLKVLGSQIDFRDQGRLVDLFLLEIEAEINI